MFIVFDLDGTLANIEHRLHHIQKEDQVTKLKRKPDWGAFSRACVDDQPIHQIIRIYQALREQRHSIEIWSGRSDIVRAETENWLQQHDITGYDKLLMRFNGDFTPDDQLKEIWLNHAIRAGKKPDLVFDDHTRLVQMWRRNGIRCCQVAEGGF